MHAHRKDLAGGQEQERRGQLPPGHLRQKLADGGLPQEAALATLDLAKYYVRIKDDRAASTALSVAPFLHALGIERDARGAVLLSQIVMADAEGADLELLISDLYAEIASRPSIRRMA